MDNVYFGPDEKETHRSIKAMCVKLLPTWKDACLEDVVVSTISGGISNLIVKVAPSETHLAPVAFKVFGKKTELLVDREKERKTLMTLNSAGFGAKASCWFRVGQQISHAKAEPSSRESACQVILSEQSPLLP